MEYNELVEDFVSRTAKNLDLIRTQADQENSLGECEKTAFEITQLVNSLLGILVLPRERFYNSIPTTPIAKLESKGWPSPLVCTGHKEDPRHLRDLVRKLRNAVAHFNLEFGETGGQINSITFANKCQCGTVLWSATLNLEELDQLVDRMLELTQSA